MLKLGKYRIPLSRPIVEMRRKSRTFWQILGEHQIASTILRVPITFPPEKFNGRMLSAMCTPDLLGTQGTFALYTTRNCQRRHGERQSLSADARKTACTTAKSKGPQNHMEEGAGAMKIPFTLKPNGKGRATLHDRRASASSWSQGEYTPWVTLTFKASLRHHGHAASRAFCSPRPSPSFRSTRRRSTSIPKIPRCRSRTRRTTPPTWPNCSAPIPRWGWRRTPGR